MSERGDAELVEGILEAVARVKRYVANTRYDAFLHDTMRQDAVVRNLGIIGEAVKRLSGEFRRRHAAIKWSEVAGMRNRLVHDYFGVNWAIVWDAVQTKLPELETALRGR